MARSVRVRLVQGVAFVIAFVLSVAAALRGGYIGPDYPTHLARLSDASKIFDFSTTKPPIYYLFGHALLLIIGPNNGLPITLSIIQIAINLVALWIFFDYFETRFSSSSIYLALVLFLTFLPVRVIHATTIGTDSMTVPLFVLLLVLFTRLLSNEKSSARDALCFGLALALAIWVKYSFMAILPAAGAILVWLGWKRKWRLRHFVLICALCFTLPAGLSAHSFWASSRVHGYNTEKHWLAKGASPDMNYADLFSVKKNDLQLFEAPEYFKRQILGPHAHGYLALAHLGIFTDTMNLFQVLSVPQGFHSILIPDQKIRSPWKTRVMQISMILGLPWTLLAMIGTVWLLDRAASELNNDDLQREGAAALFGMAYFLLMFLPIPFVWGGALFGYWTPRLILPSLAAFFLAAFLFIDRKLVSHFPRIAPAALALVVLQCAVEIVMLS